MDIGRRPIAGARKIGLLDSRASDGKLTLGGPYVGETAMRTANSHHPAIKLTRYETVS
jgi:hypothetical protein